MLFAIWAACWAGTAAGSDGPALMATSVMIRNMGCVFIEDGSDALGKVQRCLELGIRSPFSKASLVGRIEILVFVDHE